MICLLFVGVILFFFFKQKTAYEMRISDWSSDVCSSDLRLLAETDLRGGEIEFPQAHEACTIEPLHLVAAGEKTLPPGLERIGKIGRASCRERVCQYV